MPAVPQEPAPGREPAAEQRPAADPDETAEMTAVRPLRLSPDTARRPQLPPLAETAVHPAAPPESAGAAPTPVLDRKPDQELGAGLGQDDDAVALAPEPAGRSESQPAGQPEPDAEEPSAWIVSLWVLIVFLIAILVFGIFLLSR